MGCLIVGIDAARSGLRNRWHGWESRYRVARAIRLEDCVKLGCNNCCNRLSPKWVTWQQGLLDSRHRCNSVRAEEWMAWLGVEVQGYIGHKVGGLCEVGLH
ncbi:hypothetical protein C1H46_019296 [Malus baccata]|uniref:Uncharacterized protein n=1 Tax=Malus baccata TaxID=106549 RepID=A0A540M8L1_MALBA|nr:hypothetical protein C1H46_019296 [Malus baccata]